MRIGDISRETAVSRRLLRYYEEQGPLQPKRRTNGYREYTESDIVAVRHIRVLLAAGLPTTVIARILHCIRDDGEGVVPSGLSGSDRPPAAGERANYQGDYPAPGDSTGTRGPAHLCPATVPVVPRGRRSPERLTRKLKERFVPAGVLVRGSGVVPIQGGFAGGLQAATLLMLLRPTPPLAAPTALWSDRNRHLSGRHQQGLERSGPPPPPVHQPGRSPPRPGPEQRTDSRTRQDGPLADHGCIHRAHHADQPVCMVHRGMGDRR